MEGWKLYFFKLSNLFDFGVCSFILMFFLIGFLIRNFAGDLSEFLSVTILIIRTSVVYIRTVVFIKNLSHTEVSVIDLEDMGDSQN